MRLYLSAESKNNVGYTPDWLRFTFDNGETKQELTLDIIGNVDYDNQSLNCRCKGELIPWSLHDYATHETLDLYELQEAVEVFTEQELVALLEAGYDFEIGISLTNDSEETFELAKSDVLTGCHAVLEIFDGEKEHRVEFSPNLETEFEPDYER